MIDAHLVQQAKNAISGRLSERTLPKSFVGLDEQYTKIKGLMKRTIAMGESNSCLLLGPRGTGKSSIIRQILEDLSTEFSCSQTAPASEVDMQVEHVSSLENSRDFMTIHLNGMVQTDDRTALKEIMRQLSREGESELAASGTSSFADSLPSLLTFLKAGTKTQQPIIFILDEFDLFAQHTKQALLYNLFDVAQSAEWPIVVVGVTCRLDALDLLEKRVKSRFSHRQIYTFPPDTFHDYSEICRNTLLLSYADFVVPGDATDKEEDEHRDAKAELRRAYIVEFNRHVHNLFQDGGFARIIHRIFDLMKDVRSFHRICYGPVAELSESHPFLMANQFYDVGMQQRVDTKAELLNGISLLELSLLIAIKHLIEREATVFNFEMVYDEYKDFMDAGMIRGISAPITSVGGGPGGGASTERVTLRLYKKAVALKAFENLVQTELLRPSEASSKGPKEYRMMRATLKTSQIRDVVLKHRDIPSFIKNEGI